MITKESIMPQILYLRMKKKLQVQVGQTIRIADVCQLLPEQAAQQLGKLPLCTAESTQGNYFVIDVLDVCRLICNQLPAWDLRQLGPAQTIVSLLQREPRFPRWLAVGIVWLILFIGSGLTIMNFHTDVSMPEVHARIYYLLTGEKVNNPLILQIPYSFGIGAGMILFFNHLFKKKFSDEPSPMDLEIFQYQETIDQYVIEHERKKDE
jgi:stage V sporulation protein AA